VRQLGGNHFEASRFKTSVDLTDDVFCNRVRFDDGKSAFDSHGEIPKYFLIKPTILTRVKGFPMVQKELQALERPKQTEPIEPI
jgi:hypothetical protein